MKVESNEKEKFQTFVEKNYYLSGTYDKKENFKELNAKILNITKINTQNHEKSYVFSGCNRIFYLALPPSVYLNVIELLGTTCKASLNNYTRIVVEKPFGKDLNL